MKSNVLNVRDYLELLTHIYYDAVSKCAAGVSTKHDLTMIRNDLNTIRSRVEKEGMSFLTITLPQFAKDFERSLANQRMDSTLFKGFRRVKRGSIPAFLQGMTSLLFDIETGELFNVEQISKKRTLYVDSVVESLRQVCRAFHRTELPCTPERLQAAYSSFTKIEQSFKDFRLSEKETASFLAVSHILWGSIVNGFDPFKCYPRHGPGATADHISGNQKYAWLYWYDKLEPYFPLIGTAYPLGTEYQSSEVQIVNIVQAEQELPVKVIAVPKTLKTPRIIAIEPCCMQFAQQGIRDYLYKGIEDSALTRGHVNFRDQLPNQVQAIVSSSTGLSATIDLSDASDRVPRSLALAMFWSNLDFHDSIDACRTNSAKLPSGDVISPLAKFASMGSALCFPIEAMYFYTICVVALLDSKELSYTSRNVFNVTREVYVYGDDIVVPSANAAIVLDYLQKYHCKVNTAKSFWTGKFRESCGIDAYNGYQVTPVYIRRVLPKNKQQSSSIISAVESANQFYKKGYWATADFLYTYIEGIIGPLPYVREDSEALGRISFLGYRTANGWNDDLQCLQVKALVPRPVYRTDELRGYAALSKCLMRLDPNFRDQIIEESIERFDFSRILSTDKLHLERSALHGAVTLKRRWAVT